MRLCICRRLYTCSFESDRQSSLVEHTAVCAPLDANVEYTGPDPTLPIASAALATPSHGEGSGKAMCALLLLPFRHLMASAEPANLPRIKVRNPARCNYSLPHRLGVPVPEN